MQSIELVNLSQKIILYFLRKNISDETIINKIAGFLKAFPISQDAETDAFLEQQNAVAEVAVSRDGKNTLLLKTTATVCISDIMVVIHEYAHGLSGDFSISGNKIGNLKINTILEEAMAVNFSEACINEWIKDSDAFSENKNGIIEASAVYPEERNILNSILFSLNNNSLSIKIMLEYILGDKQKFYDVLFERLGQKFSEIFFTIENEIIKRNKMPTGYGFRDRKEIKEINDMVSEALSSLIADESLIGLSFENMDLTNAQNRYFKTSSIVKKRYFQQILAAKLIANGELSMSDVEDLLLFDHFENLDINELQWQSKRIKEWTNETGYTIADLVQYGAKSSDIEVLLYKFDGQTGERIDRKSKVEEFIQNVDKRGV